MFGCFGFLTNRVRRNTNLGTNHSVSTSSYLSINPGRRDPIPVPPTRPVHSYRSRHTPNVMVVQPLPPPAVPVHRVRSAPEAIAVVEPRPAVPRHMAALPPTPAIYRVVKRPKRHCRGNSELRSLDYSILDTAMLRGPSSLDSSLQSTFNNTMNTTVFSNIAPDVVNNAVVSPGEPQSESQATEVETSEPETSEVETSEPQTSEPQTQRTERTELDRLVRYMNRAYELKMKHTVDVVPDNQH